MEGRVSARIAISRNRLNVPACARATCLPPYTTGPSSKLCWPWAATKSEDHQRARPTGTVDRDCAPGPEFDFMRAISQDEKMRTLRHTLPINDEPPASVPYEPALDVRTNSPHRIARNYGGGA